ncbi:acyl-CoA synthetase [Pseudomonas sp. N040]|uniref:acyl-CoA synthetase n=1 Tax=Pseudomonas sp. N040 TaxID=2785325 RepID=UPI0018A2A705|nr:acyl-CoA synthetase [Pseudomonas sp. N040]MBF7730470.1 acyl-CoA synthetase [Pseudomonas sp. N040]MBW7014113.1 acyl-CoA synthetase [Pseudomonas sp. N040]
MSIRTLQDILTLEQNPLPTAGLDSTYALLARGAAIDPQAPALSFFVRVEDHATPARWNHAQLLGEITRAANLFHRLGIRRGGVVACILPNLPETHFTLWGAETAGTVFAVNPQLDGAQMAELLRAAGVQWIVTLGPQPDADIWRRVAGAIGGLAGLQGILAVDPLHHLPGHTPAQSLPATLEGVPVLDFHAELAAEDARALGFAAPVASDIASYFCTGGTTGLPKIAQHSQANEVANALQLAAVAGAQIAAPGRTTLAALPLFHVNAQLGSGLTPFAHGGHVLLAPAAGYRSPGLIPRFWEIIARHRVNSFSAVPTIYAALLQVPRDGQDLSSLKLAICGAAPMPVELFRSFERETGMRIVEGYGLTESTCVASINPPDGESRIGSIGLRLPWQEMRVMRFDAAGNWQGEAALDEVGVLCLSGPNVFAGYLSPQHNKDAWLETGAADGRPQRWFNTGDLGRLDAEGYFWLSGRKKELIIRGGHNIDPKSIEEVLAGHPAVALCAAVGRPDAYAGEVPVAYVQLRQGALASEAELLAYAAQHISERAAVPKAIHILDALPVTAVGKTFKPALNLREIESVVREEAAQVGATLSQLTVEQDPKLGMLARYRVEGDGSALASALGRHIFRSEAL